MELPQCARTFGANTAIHWRRSPRRSRAVVTETDAHLTPKQPHQLALFTEVDLAVQSRLSSMVSGLRYDAFYMTRKQGMKEGTTGGYPTIGAGFLREQRFWDTVVMHPLPRVDELSRRSTKIAENLLQTGGLRRTGTDGAAEISF